MKKRFAALLLALALIAALVPSPAGAASVVYFTAGDEGILDLTDATMPFWLGGYLYVDAALLRSCGVNYVYNTVQQRAVLYDFSGHSLVFDLSAGTATDNQGGAYPAAQLRGGVVFIPAEPVAAYFGRTYFNARVNHGYLIRIHSAGSMADSLFLDAAPSTMERRYQEYTGAAPDDSGVPDPDASDEGQSPISGKTIYLCLEVQDPALAGEWLAALNARNVYAAFYFREEALADSGPLLRRLAAQGQSIGLIVPPAGDAAADQLARMNQTLFDEAGVKTRLAYLPGGDANPPAGYRALRPALDRGAYGLSTAGGASSLLSRVAARRGAEVSVWLGANVTAAGLRAFLSGAARGDHRLSALTETAG